MPLKAFCAVTTVAGVKVSFSAISHFHIGEVSHQKPFRQFWVFKGRKFFLTSTGTLLITELNVPDQNRGTMSRQRAVLSSLKMPPLPQASSALHCAGGLRSCEQFRTDSQGSELLPEGANTCPSQGKPVWMLIPQSQGASEEAGTGRCAGSLIK